MNEDGIAILQSCLTTEADDLARSHCAEAIARLCEGSQMTMLSVMVQKGLAILITSLSRDSSPQATYINITSILMNDLPVLSFLDPPLLRVSHKVLNVTPSYNTLLLLSNSTLPHFLLYIPSHMLQLQHSLSQHFYI